MCAPEVLPQPSLRGFIHAVDTNIKTLAVTTALRHSSLSHLPFLILLLLLYFNNSLTFHLLLIYIFKKIESLSQCSYLP